MEILSSYNNVNLFIKDVNKLRLSNTNKWHFVYTTVEGKEVKIKFFKTWLQIYRVNDKDFFNCMERSITQFKSDLLIPFNKVKAQ